MPSAASVSEQDYGLSTQQDANQCWSSICSSPRTLYVPRPLAHTAFQPVWLEAYGTGHTVVLYTVLLGAVGSHVLSWLATRQSFSYKWGPAGRGEKHMFMFDCSILMTPPGQLVYTVYFHDLYPVDISHLSFKVLFLLFLLLYFSVVFTLLYSYITSTFLCFYIFVFYIIIIFIIIIIGIQLMQGS